MAAMPNFTYHRPTTLDSALELLSVHAPDVRVLAGGTDLIPQMRAGTVSIDHLVSLDSLAELRELTYSPDKGLVIGAGAKVSEVGEHEVVCELFPALQHACTVMATTQVRNMATVVGNISNCSPCADTSAPLLVYGARAVVADRDRTREVELSDFFTGPKQNILAQNELVMGLHVPTPPTRSGSVYMRLSARSKVDMAAVGVAGLVALGEEGRVELVRLALGAVAPTPVRCTEAEALIRGQIPNDELLTEVAEACRLAAAPIDDVRASASYRSAMVGVLARRVVEQCLVEARGGAV